MSTKNKVLKNSEKSLGIPYCLFCDGESSYKIVRSGATLCESCKGAYECGQANPNGELEAL